jgi:uncharacterized linocin/CFP29 family protein
MANKYLARDDAPFGAEVWEALDAAALGAARGQLAGRRLLHVEGPYGLGLKVVPLQDAEMEAGFVARALPLVLIRKGFSLGVRDLAAFEREKIALDLGPVAEAATAAARQEDALIFLGATGVPGLLSAEGVHELTLSPWEQAGAAAEDIVRAMTALDDAGFHGPYALGLAPALYNRLFRLYPHGNQSEMEHLKTMVADGVFKAPVLESGGVLLATGRQYAVIVLGQDMAVGFVGPAEGRLEFSISESLVPLIRQPGAICMLK